MTKLLVSVADLEEARLACDAGVDIVDVKDPSQGSLGAATSPIRRAISHELRERYVLSAACGELLDWNPVDPRAGGDLWDGYRYAKIGLAGADAFTQWRDAWHGWRKSLPVHVAPVMVVYADWEKFAAPAEADVRELAVAAGCPVIMVDTYDKAGPSLMELWTPAQVEMFGRFAHDNGMTCVIAGGLTLENLPTILDRGIDYVAARGAVCVDDRNAMRHLRRIGALCKEKIRAWRNILLATNSPIPD